jgi:NTP pyrophosphatase (non-canonical NTP hydrolase)
VSPKGREDEPERGLAYLQWEVGEVRRAFARVDDDTWYLL